MTNGFCVVGDAVSAPAGGTNRVAVFYTSQPTITYRSTPADRAFWGNDYETLNNGWSFVVGKYSIFQSSQNACNLESFLNKYDCINGACFPSNQFNTPGLYNSLAECEQACGTGCSGKCISNEDWVKIQSLASQLKNKNCS